MKKFGKEKLENPLTKLLASGQNISKPIPQERVVQNREIPNNLFLSSNILPLNNRDKIRITINDYSLKYTPLGVISLQNVIDAYKPVWSGCLTSYIEGDMIVLKSSPSDNRRIEDRIIEFVKIACVIQHLANFFGLNRDPKPSIEVSEQYLYYIPTRFYQEFGGLFMAPISVIELLLHLLRGVIPNLEFIPKAGIPQDVRIYVIPSQGTEAILNSFVFREDDVQRYVVYDKGRIDLINGKIEEIATIVTPERLKSLITLENLNTVISIQAWKYVKSQDLETSKSTIKVDTKELIKVRSYENAIAYFIYLKKHYREKILFEAFVSPVLGIKIIRHYFWAPVEVINALLDAGFLKDEHFIGNDIEKIGNTGVGKWGMTPEGLNIIKYIFGNGINQTEFRVRPLGKAEIVSGDPETFDILDKILKKEERNVRIMERAVIKNYGGSLTFEANYFIIMKIYFAIKLIRGATLISEMNPIQHLMGYEALISISEKTPFGTLHILKVPKGNTMDVFLISKNPEALNALLSAVSEDVKNSIILQEIEPGILGKKLTGSSVFYVFYALDQSSP